MSQFEQEVHGLAEKVARGYGFDSLTGKIITILFLEPGEIALDNLAKQTGYSLSTLSTKMKVMENFGFIKRIRKPGSKKIYFYMEKDIEKMAIDKLHLSIQAEIVPVKNQLPAILSKHRQKIMNSKDERQRQQFRIVENYLNQMIKFEKVIRDLIIKLGA